MAGLEGPASSEEATPRMCLLKAHLRPEPSTRGPGQLARQQPPEKRRAQAVRPSATQPALQKPETERKTEPGAA